MFRSVLYEEHLLLGAVLEEGAEGRALVASYPQAPADDELLGGCALADLSGLGSRLLAGQSAADFARAAFAGRALDVGAVSFQAALTGDGALVSAPLVARTGAGEFCWWNLDGRGDTLAAWLSFVRQVERDGTRAFPDLACEDASEALVALLLCGAQAPVVLADYLGPQPIPVPGTIRPSKLDRIPCLVAAVALCDEPSYLVLVPPSFARVLWRSLLSFAQVSPVGARAVTALFARSFPCAAGLVAGSGAGRVLATREELVGAGLAREGTDFVGGRALA